MDIFKLGYTGNNLKSVVTALTPSNIAAVGGRRRNDVITWRNNQWVNAPIMANVTSYTNLTPTWELDTDNTVPGHPYKGTLVCAGVTAENVAYVAFDADQAESSNYASICETDAEQVYIWGKTNAEIVVPSVLIF